jgi:phenylacetate-CoA ligase
MASLTNLLLTVGGIPLGGSFRETLNTMKEVQWSPIEELHARSQARLGALLKHVSLNVPFYRDLYRRLGLKPNELNTISDLKALPILRKADYRERRAEVFFAANVKSALRLDRKTSGSTGEPFHFSLDRRVLPVIFASHLFYDSWHGFQPFDRYIRIVAPAAARPGLAGDAPVTVRLQHSLTVRLQDLYERCTQQTISLWEVDSERAETVWRRIEAFRPKFVMGYTSTVAAIADELQQRNLRLSQPVEGVITIAETLTPNRKKLIEKYFEAPIINRYGLREFGSWSAQSCRESPDRFHVNTELVVWEILRPDGTPCASDETGRLVLTDLHNFARPFIRYDTGDLAMAVSEKCGCGRGFPLLGSIEGRSLECLRTPSGKEISPAILGHFLFVYHDHLGAVRHYQLVQQTANRASLLIVPGEAWDDQRENRIRSDLTRLMGDEVEVAVKIVGEIPPEKSGKRPIIKRAPDRAGVDHLSQ